METTSLGIGTHGNMSAGGELINKSISASNLAYGRKNNAKIAKFYEAVVTMLHNMAADDKLNLLAEYGDTGKLNRTRSNLDDVLAETIIINLPASELETLVKDVRADEAALKKDITTIRKRQKKNRIKTNFNADSFEDVYGKLGQAKNARQYMKLRKKLVGGFKIPRYMKSAYANLGREIKDILTNFYDKIEVSALAAEMGIDIVPGMKDREVQHAIINKTLLYVDLLVGKSKNKTNYSGAIVDKAPYDRLLSLTSYSWVTGKPGMSKEEYFKARAEAMAAKKEMRARLKMEDGIKWFNGRKNLAVKRKANKLKTAIDKGDLSGTGLNNKELLLDMSSGKPKLKDIYEIYALASKYHINFKEKDDIYRLVVRIDREISREKKRLVKMSNSLGMQKGERYNYRLSESGKGKINDTDKKTNKILGLLRKPSKKLKEYIAKGVADGRFVLHNGKYYYSKYDENGNPEYEILKDKDGNPMLDENGNPIKTNKIARTNDEVTFMKSKGNFIGNAYRAIRYGRKKSVRRNLNEAAIRSTIDESFNPEKDVTDRNLEKAKKEQKALSKSLAANGSLSQLYDNVPVLNLADSSGTKLSGMAVPTLDMATVLLSKYDIDEAYRDIANATPVLVVNKGFGGSGKKDDTDAVNNFGAGVLNDTILRKADGTLALSDALKIKKLDVGPKSGADLSKDDIKALQEDSKKYGDHISPAYLRPEALALGFNKKNKKGSEPERVTPVFVVNKEPEDLTYSWLSTEFPKYMMGFATDVVAAPMGTGTIARPTLAAAAGTSLGMSIANDALKLADAQIGSLLGLATGGSGKANSTVTSFISGDSPRGLGDKNSYPEQVDIDWKNKSFNVKPIPTYATGVRAEAGKDKVTRFSKKERNAPMAIGFSSHVVRFNRKLDGVSGETDIGEAIKVYNVNNTAGISDKVNIDGTNTSLIELVGNMCKQLAVISEQLKTNNTTIIPIEGQTPIIEAPNISFQYPAKQNLVSTSFPDSLDSILQGV